MGFLNLEKVSELNRLFYEYEIEKKKNPYFDIDFDEIGKKMCLCRGTI